jgi:hypothetical protein
MTSHATTESLARSEPAPSSAAAQRASRFALGVLGVVWLAAAAVFWAFDALPFQDLPAHAGLIALRHRFAESPFEQQHFVLASNLGPYSLFRFLGEGFHRVFGPVGAVRALGTLPILATPAALWYARRRLHGDTSLAAPFFGIALSFGLMTLLGFASFLLGLAVLLVVLTMWLDMLRDLDEGRPTIKKELALAFAAIFLFVAHGHAFMVGMGLLAVATFARHTTPSGGAALGARVLRLRVLAPAVALALYAAWLSRAGNVPSGSVAVATSELKPVFHSPLEKLGLLVTPTMTTRTGLDIIAACVIWFVVGVAAVRTARALWPLRTSGNESASRGHARALLVCAAAVTIVFLVLPHSIGWFGFVDGRLVPLMLLLLVMAIDRDAMGGFAPTLDRAAPATASLLVALALAGSYRFQDEARGYREVLARIPAQARLLNMPLDPNSDVFTAHPFIHYDKLVLADRPIVVSDIWFHQGTALFPTPANPALQLPRSYVHSNLEGIDWPAYRMSDWDYVLVRTRPEGAPGPLPEILEPDAHEGGWWLYRVAKIP